MISSKQVLLILTLIPILTKSEIIEGKNTNDASSESIINSTETKITSAVPPLINNQLTKSYGTESKINENQIPVTVTDEVLPRSNFLRQNNMPFTPLWIWSSSTKYQSENVNKNNNVPTTYQPNKNQIFFGDLKRNSNLKLNCTPTQTQYNGSCYETLKQLPCNPGQWLIEDESSNMGKCVENQCSKFSNLAFFNGKCISVRSEESCPSGMKTYILKSGKVECDCKEGFLYHEKDGNCYEAYRQGPCRLCEYLAIPITSSKYQKGPVKPTCLRNPCFIDGYYCYGPNCDSTLKSTLRSRVPNKLPKNCIKFGSHCTAEGNGLLVIHPETNRPYCQKEFENIQPVIGIAGRIIGNVPTLRCAPGSRRDILGNCRTPTIIDFS